MDDSPPALMELPLRPARQPAPIRVSLRELLTALSVDDASVERIDVALTVWSFGPRLDVGIDQFSISAM